MEWISVKDGLPKTFKTVLVYSKTNGVRSDYLRYVVNNVFYFNGTPDLLDTEVTHWMPLPEPPEQ